MKKLLLASAVAALSISAAQAAPTVYGKAFLTLDVADGNNNSEYKDSRTQLNSKASRIGFKGSEALTANTDLVYQLEYGVDVDAGTKLVLEDPTDPDSEKVEEKTQQFYARDTYLGLSNKQYGTVLAGRLTGIDGEVDYANVTKGGVVGGDGVLASFDAIRFNNTFAYVSPSYNGLTFMGAYVMDENKPTDTIDRDAVQLAVKYEQAALKAGLAYTQAGDFKATRVSGAYDLSPVLTVGGLYQLTDYDTNKNENTFTVSGKLKTATPWTAYGQVDVVSNLEGVDHKKQRLVVGGEYGFNKNTTGHLYGAYLKDKQSGNNSNSYGVGAGIEYKF